MNEEEPEKRSVFDKKDLLRTVKSDETDLRLDRWFKRHFPSLTHGQLQKWLRKGQIRIDGRRSDSSFRLQEDQIIKLTPALLNDPKFYKIAPKVGRPVKDLDRLKKLVLFEDDDVIVLNKPAGLAVQGGTGLKENLDDSLMIFSRDGISRPKLVHRLDKDTSGVLLIARTDFAAAKLAKAFRQRTTQKIYWAACVGLPSEVEGIIDEPLIKQGQLMFVAQRDESDTKKATTLYKIAERAGKKASFLVLWPLTGRTHQLRVHLEHIQTPIIGDPLYNFGEGSDLPFNELGQGLHLHARRIILPHPRGGTIDVTAPLGKEMKKTWKWFGFDENTDLMFEGNCKLKGECKIK